jgi:prolyl-tRNA synthetase
VAQKIHSELLDAGVEVLLDDRDERAGVKFADADLIGIPYRVVIGKKGLADGVVELKRRADGHLEKIRPIDVANKMKELLSVV